MGTMTIDGRKVEFTDEKNVLTVIRNAGINIPTLCYHSELSTFGACRLCTVEDDRGRTFASCSEQPRDGMVIYTNSGRIKKYRKLIVELLLAAHCRDCTTCVKSGECILQELAHRLGVRNIRFENTREQHEIDESSPSIIRDPNKCILCGNCVRACEELQGIGALGFAFRGTEAMVMPAFNKKITETQCVNCGQCRVYCPTGAISIRTHMDEVWDALADKDTRVVAQIAPAVRVAVGDHYGLAKGRSVMGKIVNALHKMGFDEVYDTTFSADLTIMEEGYELLDRIKNGGTLPMITSCCPGWVKFCETFSPKELDHLSSAKSPQQMFGAVIKTYYAEKAGVDPKDICSISIMPCTAKKFECLRPEFHDSGYQDVDLSLTVVELANMIKAAGINFKELEETPFDTPFGLGSGAGEIFGATGGVMEAALRTVYEVITGKELPRLDFTEVRGVEGLKEAVIDIDGLEVKVAVVHSLSNAREMLRKVRAGKADYHFIEVMACPGGCVGGGGTPVRSWKKVKARLDAAYELDKQLPIRKSHENPAIKEIYAEFLGEPLSEKAHHLLHTSYISRRDLLS